MFLPQGIKSGGKHQLPTALFLARAFTIVNKGCSSRFYVCWSCRSKPRCLIERTPSLSLLWNILSVAFWNEARLRPSIPMLDKQYQEEFLHQIKPTEVPTASDTNQQISQKIHKLLQLFSLTFKLLLSMYVQQSNKHSSRNIGLGLCPLSIFFSSLKLLSHPSPVPMLADDISKQLCKYSLWSSQSLLNVLRNFFGFFQSKETLPFFWEEQACEVWLNTPTSLLPFLFLQHGSLMMRPWDRETGEGIGGRSLVWKWPCYVHRKNRTIGEDNRFFGQRNCSPRIAACRVIVTVLYVFSPWGHQTQKC